MSNPIELPTAIFIHSSNEMFGADRMLFRVIQVLLEEGSFRPEVWLPNDVAEAVDSLSTRLAVLGVVSRTMSLPILRRKYITAVRLPGLIGRLIQLTVRLIVARPAVVWCGTSAALLAAPSARLACCRQVVLHNQEIWSGSEARLLGPLAACCSRIIAISEASRASLKGRAAARSITIYNGSDEQSPPPHPVDQSAPGPLEFLMAGRWNSWKGHTTLLAAWNECDPAPGHLTIVGSPPDAGQAVDVWSLVRELDSPQTVTVVGQVDDITPFIDAADFMLVPSDTPEPFGLVAIEAFARHRAVIASGGGGLGEIVTSRVDGILFPNRDALALARVLASLDRATAFELGEGGRSTFDERFTLGVFFSEMRIIWRDLSFTFTREAGR